MASDSEVLILIPAALHSAVYRSSVSWRPSPDKPKISAEEPYLLSLNWIFFPFLKDKSLQGYTTLYWLVKNNVK